MSVLVNPSMITFSPQPLNVNHRKPPQQQPRQDLAEIIATHLSSEWLRPVAEHSRDAFDCVHRRVDDSTAPLIIDSCCGTGDSTRNLALAFPDALVLGIDKSEHRLARHRASSNENYSILRADVNDCWRLAAEAGWQPAQHFLLYPNPYPKASQFRKRWYGSPAFAALINLGGLLTVRTKWSVYAEECVLALNAAGFQASGRQLSDEKPITAFETKYKERGDSLIEVVSDLDQVALGTT